jgi:MOSC domain-containing protein YiiM
VTTTAKLLGIAIKPKRLQPMHELDAVELSIAFGLAGDSRGKPGPRQVTLMTQTAWRTACADLGVELPWTTRRANLLVDDLPLFQTTGARILIGAAVLEITGETDPCSRMEKAQQGLFEALRHDWRGGVCCRVVQGGPLALDMEVALVPIFNR